MRSKWGTVLCVYTFLFRVGQTVRVQLFANLGNRLKTSQQSDVTIQSDQILRCSCREWVVSSQFLRSRRTQGRGGSRGEWGSRSGWSRSLDCQSSRLSGRESGPNLTSGQSQQARWNAGGGRGARAWESVDVGRGGAGVAGEERRGESAGVGRRAVRREGGIGRGSGGACRGRGW